jgi:thiamine pyrophosphokinase
MRWQMFTHSKIALICSAPVLNPAQLRERISEFPLLIAVDGGVNHCHRLNLRPDLIIGDFDSADPTILSHFDQVPKKKFPKDKDHTDLELAIQTAFHSKVEEIVVFAALQGRTDHALGNLILLSRYPGKLFLESDAERLFVIDKSTQFDTYRSQQISLIPLNGPVKSVYTTGLKWELTGQTLDKHFISISNEATQSQVSVTVLDGDLLCCINF